MSPHKAASDCEDPYWALELVRSNEPDTELWPERARLQEWYGYERIQFGWENWRDSKIDVIEGKKQ